MGHSVLHCKCSGSLPMVKWVSRKLCMGYKMWVDVEGDWVLVHTHSHNMALELAQESIWFDKWRCDDAEKQFYEKQSGCEEEVQEQIAEVEATPVCNKTQIEEPKSNPQPVKEGDSGLGTLASQIAKARQEIQNSLAAGSGHRGGGGAAVSTDVLNRITKLEDEKTALKQTVSTMEKTILNLTKRLAALETSSKTTVPPKKSEPMEEEDDDDEVDDEVDLFGSDDEEEDADAARVREERLAAYAEKKSKKPGPIAKSSVLLDCKPWDDETDMKAMEN